MLQGETPRVLDEFARKVAKPIGDLPSNFMLDPSTYEYGSSLGFDGLDFYVRGRGGVLGEVPAAVICADGALTAEAVTAFCRERLAGYKVPRHVIVQDHPLERMASGKVARRKIRDAHPELARAAQPVG